MGIDIIINPHALLDLVRKITKAMATIRAKFKNFLDLLLDSFRNKAIEKGQIKISQLLK